MNEKYTIPYDPEVANGETLVEVLKEIERQVLAARIAVASSPKKKLVLTAAFVNNLRCVVEDAEEKLRPHYDMIDSIWEGRPRLKKNKRG